LCLNKSCASLEVLIFYQTKSRLRKVVYRIVIMQENVSKNPVVAVLFRAEFLRRWGQSEGVATITHFFHVRLSWKGKSFLLGRFSGALLQTNLDVWENAMIIAGASVGACERALFWLRALDGVVALEVILDHQEVVYWDNGITHTRVHNGKSSLDVIELIVGFGIIQTNCGHIQGPVFLLSHDLSPEDIIWLSSGSGIPLQVIASESDERSRLVWLGSQVETEHGIKLVGLTEGINLFDLAHEGLKLLLGALRCETDDAGKTILCDSVSLVTLEDLDSADTWLAVVLGEADGLLIEEPIDVSAAIAVLNPVTSGIVICLGGSLLEET
jgi:hypothetical protein